jgi:hypothetical protein
MSAAPYSSHSRWKIRVTVCRCLRGASGSARGIPSITNLNGSNRVGRRGIGFRGCGHAESSPFVTAAQPTLYCRIRGRFVAPAR